MTLASYPELEIEVFWSAHQRWQSGQSREFPPLGNAIFWIVKEGEASLEMNGTSYIVHKGEVVLQPANQHRRITASTTFEWLSVGFRARWFQGQDALRLLEKPLHWIPESVSPEFLSGGLHEISRGLRATDFASRLRVEGAMRSVLGCCFENEALLQSTREFPAWLETALAILRENPTADIKQLAIEVGYSPSQFRAQFQRWLGVPPSDYARSVRLDRARQLLRDTDWLIGRISDELGFAAPTHFVRAFKAETGITPAKFRRNCGF